jgi:hypothetical protein
LEPDKSEAREEQPAVSRRRIAIFRTLPIAVFTLLFGIVIVFLALRTAGGVRRSQEVVGGFAPFALACEGEGGPAATAYEETSGIHPVVAFRRLEGEWVLDSTLLPADWFPPTPADVELVLCLGTRSTLTAPRCTPTADGAVPTRVYGYLLPLRLVSARTGETIIEDRLNSAPRTLTCWDAEAEPEALGVSAEQIRSRISSYVDQP